MESHLLQMRGLKLFGKNLLLRRMLSHLLQMRGLKLKPKQKVSLLLCVASFTDAWIETISVFCDEESIVSRIFYRCVDWNKAKQGKVQFADGRIFYRCVDWNILLLLTKTVMRSRIFYRCVDWNITNNFKTIPAQCRIFYRCVDWNFWRKNERLLGYSRIFYRCVDWNVIYKSVLKPHEMSHLLQMRGLKPSLLPQKKCLK